MGMSVRLHGGTPRGAPRALAAVAPPARGREVLRRGRGAAARDEAARGGTSLTPLALPAPARMLARCTPLASPLAPLAPLPRSALRARAPAARRSSTVPQRRSVTTASAASPLRVDVQAVLDPACPWCFIGLRRLQRALSSPGAADVSVALRFLPYVFDADTPSPPLPWRQYVALRYPERAHAIYTQKLPYTLQQARSDGIALHRYDERPICPAVDALALLHVAEAEGRALQYVEALLSAHFEGGADTSAHDVLRALAAQVGLPAAAADEALRSGSAAQDWVWAEDGRARRELRVSGVPHYALSLSGQAAVLATLEGAQPPEAWLAAFAKLRRAA